MKKINIILLLIITILLSGCKIFNETVPNKDQVRLHLTDSFVESMHNKKAPDFVFKFNGNLNTIKNVKKTYNTVFSQNNDIILSDAINKLFDQYKDKIYFRVDGTDKVDERYFSELRDGKVHNIKMKVDDSTVYDEVAFIPLDNGLKLTIDYCRFVSDGKTYYTWRYSASIAMYLYYPIMKVKINGQPELVLLTLPNVVSLHVGPGLKLKNIMNDDEYYEDKFYNFKYFDNEKKFTLDQQKAYVRDYYQDYERKDIDKDHFEFKYEGSTFELIMMDDSFTIKWKGLN